MTLSTRAEHEFGREVDYVAEEAVDMVDGYARAEDFVLALEGSECLRPVVDAEWQGREFYDEITPDLEDAARCFTDSATVAEAAARDEGEMLADFVRSEIYDSPAIATYGSKL